MVKMILASVSGLALLATTLAVRPNGGREDDGGGSATALASDAGVQQRVIPFQGLLTGAAGAPVTDGSYNLRFTLYAVPESPAPLNGWTEVHTGVVVTGGRFSVLLGTNRSLDNPDNDNQTDDAISFAQPRYLGIQVGGDPEMRPRKQIVPAVHAYQATHASTATTAEFGGGIPGQIIMWAGPESAIPTGWLLCNGQTLDAVSNPQFADLFAVIGTTFGGTGIENFKVPDFRGRFARGFDAGANRDPQRVRGSFQDDSTRLPRSTPFSFTNASGNGGTSHVGDHSHSWSYNCSSNEGGNGNASIMGDDQIQKHCPAWNIGTSGAGAHSHSVTVSVSGAISAGGDTETRPANLAVNFIIKQ